MFTMVSSSTYEHDENTTMGEERISGDSRKWLPTKKEPNSVIKSSLQFAEKLEYLDLIVEHTSNNLDVFYSLDMDDLTSIGILNNSDCEEIIKSINLTSKFKSKINPVQLNEIEALQMINNVEENIHNISLGTSLFIDALIARPPANKFVSHYCVRSAAHDALEFIKATKNVYSHLLQTYKEEQVLTDSELKSILMSLDMSPRTKSKNKKKIMNLFKWSLLASVMVALGCVIYSKEGCTTFWRNS